MALALRVCFIFMYVFNYFYIAFVGHLPMTPQLGWSWAELIHHSHLCDVTRRALITQVTTFPPVNLSCILLLSHSIGIPQAIGHSHSCMLEHSLKV